MEIKQEYITVSKTARYSSFGNLGPKTKYFWFALHGSNMLSDQILYKFRTFDPEEHFVVAPEGLSRFYSKGFSGDVVATWMTSRDRLEEIKDFSNYLSLLYSKITAQLPTECKKIIFGFSQGGTTVFRWLHRHSVIYDHLVGNSCWIPEDINLAEAKSSINSTKIIYTYGRQDHYLSPERIKGLNSLVKKNKLDVTFLEYEGDHRVSKDQVINIFNQFIKK